MESLNVLILSEDFYPKESGGAFIDWNVAKYLVEAGDAVSVVTPRNGDTAVLESVAGVEIRRPFKGPPLETHPNSVRGILRRVLFAMFVVPYLVKLCWRRDFDLVYSTNHLFHPVAELVSTAFGVPHVSFVGYSPSVRDDVSLMNPLVFLERLNFRFFMGDRVVCRTPSVREILSDTFSGDVIRLDGIVDREAIERVIASETTGEAFSDAASGTQLIFVGRLVELKNPTKLPDILARLDSEYSLVIIGDGPQRKAIESAIEKTCVSDRVRLAGRLPHEEALRKIYEADMLVLPSKVEAYPAVVFEALTLNTPVVATPVGALPTINHPKLMTIPLKEFSNVIPEIDADTSQGINVRMLDEYSVDRFANDVRNQIIRAIHDDKSSIE